MRVLLDELRDATVQALELSGHTPEEVAAIAEVLGYGQLRGNYQSIIQWASNGINRIVEVSSIVVVRKTPVSALLDGGQANAIFVMRRATDIALELALTKGVGLVGTRNTSSGTSAVGWYARRIAEAGVIGFATSGSSKKAAHYGSYDPVYGTNPLAAAFPTTTDDPIVIDLASSAIPFFRLVEAKLLRRPLPDDVAYDSEAVPTRDPERALSGALRSFDRGPKGSALALMLEALTGPLVGISGPRSGETEENWGNLVLALDPELLAGRDTFRHEMSELESRVKSSRRIPGVDEILLPGERSKRLAAECAQQGYIEIEDEIWERFQQALARAST